MNAIYLQPHRIITPGGIVEDTAIVIRDGVIAQIGPSDALPRPTGASVLDADGLTLAPGFIDLQLNGAFGCDFTDDPETIWEVARRLPRYGVTSFLPTIITSPPDAIAQAQEVLRKGPPDGFLGATPLGLHLEGPFLNPGKRGAHNPAHLRLHDIGLIRDWSPEQGVRLVTLAPELQGADKVIAALLERGVIVSAGHSMATYEQGTTAFNAGISYSTHLFNAMPPLDHREPGLPLAALDQPRVTTGIIADGIHVHPAMVALAWKLKGQQHLNLVTDAMAALGMPPGQFMLGDHRVISDGKSARLPDGRLAGSVLSLDEAVRNLIAFTGCNLEEAIATVTSTPARLLNMGASIEPGQPANLVLLNSSLEVVATIVQGEVCYGA